MDEQEKRYFLVAYLVTQKKHQEAELFWHFASNDEYIFTCPNCSDEYFLWNEDNVLNAYIKDPVFHKNQEKLPINLKTNSTNLDWLENIVEQLEIQSLKPMLTYFKAALNCPNCKTSSTIFDGIRNML